MSGISIDRKLHTGMTKVLDAKSADYNTIASLTAVKCDGYNKLMVQYIVTTGWDRVADIYVYGAFYPTGTYTGLDDTIEGYKFSVGATDDTSYGGLGQIYFVESIPPWIKVGLDVTTAGTTGTITVLVMPFNS